LLLEKNVGLSTVGGKVYKCVLDPGYKTYKKTFLCNNEAHTHSLNQGLFITSIIDLFFKIKFNDVERSSN
jgi:hypothetical protein